MGRCDSHKLVPVRSDITTMPTIFAPHSIGSSNNQWTVFYLKVVLVVYVVCLMLGTELRSLKQVCRSDCHADGVVPNPAMENTFLAQAGDLDDPVSNLNCYHAGCCTNMSKSPTCTEGIGCDKVCKGGSTPDYSWEDTPVYMGPIHPRDKKPVGVSQRSIFTRPPRY